MKGMNSNLLNNQMLDTYDPAKASTLFALFVKNATWQVPTLTIRHARPYLKELQASNDPRLKYIPKSITDDWGPTSGSYMRSLAPREAANMMAHFRYSRQKSSAAR